MKPYEFWNSTYREITLYTQANLGRLTDQIKQEIQLQEAVTNKLIQADAMSNRRPKIISLFKTFERLFPKKEDKKQSYEEITKRMRQLMKN